MVRPIQRYGQIVLQHPAAAVEAVDGEVQALIDDMIETMHAAPGIGLAAPQIGVPRRVFVIDLSVGADRDAIIALVNPTFVERTGMQLEDEGCLSLPGFTATVARPERIVIRGLDRQGQARTLEGTGLLARAFQHEMDHLDGRLFTDRLRGLQRDAILRRVQALTRAGQW